MLHHQCNSRASHTMYTTIIIWLSLPTSPDVLVEMSPEKTSLISFLLICVAQYELWCPQLTLGCKGWKVSWGQRKPSLSRYEALQGRSLTDLVSAGKAASNLVSGEQCTLPLEVIHLTISPARPLSTKFHLQSVITLIWVHLQLEHLGEWFSLSKRVNSFWVASICSVLKSGVAVCHKQLVHSMILQINSWSKILPSKQTAGLQFDPPNKQLVHSMTTTRTAAATWKKHSWLLIHRLVQNGQTLKS